MDLDAYAIAEQEILPPPPPPEPLKRGTIGWDGVDSVIDFGKDDGSPGSGRSLVRVTLYAGRDPSKAPRPGVADGHPVLVQRPMGMASVPPKGTQVLLGFPDGDHATPGSGIILAVYGDDVDVGNPSDGDLAIIPTNGGQGRIYLKKDGSISLVTKTDNDVDGYSVYLRFTPSGLHFAAPWGTMTFDATGFHLKSHSGARLDLGGLSIPGVPDTIVDAIGSYATLSAAVVNAAGNLVNLGSGDTFAPALVFPMAGVPGLPIGTALLGGPAPTGAQSGRVQIAVP